MVTKPPLTEPIEISAAEVYMLDRPYPLREVEFERLVGPSRSKIWLDGIWPASLIYIVPLAVRYGLGEPVHNWEWTVGGALVVVLIVAAVFARRNTARSKLIGRVEAHYAANEPQEVTKT